MEKYLFMKPVLDFLGVGANLRRCVVTALKVAAALAVVAGVVAFVDAWNFTAGLPGTQIPGGVVYMVLFVAGVYMAVHAILIRAAAVAGLPDTELTLVPVFAVLSLLAGEALAAFGIALSVGGGVLIWFTGGNAYGLIKGFHEILPGPSGESFGAGLSFIVRGAFRSAAVLLTGYLVSELFIVLERIAANARLGAEGGKRDAGGTS